jgi:hypothetical protein
LVNTEKLVYQTLADVGLPNGKNDQIDLEVGNKSVHTKQYLLMNMFPMPLLLEKDIFIFLPNTQKLLAYF